MKKFFLALVACVISFPSAQALEPLIDESAMDRAVNPCNDFYTYACGGWIKRTELPPDQPSWTRSFSSIYEDNSKQLKALLDDYSNGIFTTPSPYQNILGEFYGSCMNEASLEGNAEKHLPTFFSKIDELGTIESLSSLVIKFKLLGYNILFNIDTQADFKDSNQMLANLDQGGLGLQGRDYYWDTDEKKEKIRNQYQELIVKMFNLIGIPIEQAKHQAEAVLKIETRLAEKALTPVERRDPQALYHPMTLAELEKLAPNFEWKELFSKLEINPGLNIAVPRFFSALNEIIKTTSAEDFKSYLKWHILAGMTGGLDKKLRDASFDFYGRVLKGQKEQLPRWKTCLASTDALLGDPLGQAFIQTHFSESNKQKASQILKTIQGAFRENLASVRWMDPDTQTKALEKLNKIENKIGYPDRWEDFSSVKINSSYFSNLMELAQYNTLMQLHKAGKPTDRTEWDMKPQTVNAYYSPEMNEIVFPAAILQPPIFNSSSPLAANYGAIGMIIGHELTHAFDDEGRQYDLNGNLNNWWSESSSQLFSKKAQCLIDQYSQYTVGQDVHLKGELTLGENIADLGGLKFAYSAYKKATMSNELTTDDTVFFIAFAQAWCSKSTPQYEELMANSDPHSPPRYRVNGVLQNRPEFAQAFSCAPNTPMAPAQRCEIW